MAANYTDPPTGPIRETKKRSEDSYIRPAQESLWWLTYLCWDEPNALIKVQYAPETAKKVLYVSGDKNINSWMVRNGHAVAYSRYSKRYVPEELLARVEKVGLHSGSFEDPAAYRKRMRP